MSCVPSTAGNGLRCLKAMGRGKGVPSWLDSQQPQKPGEATPDPVPHRTRWWDNGREEEMGLIGGGNKPSPSEGNFPQLFPQNFTESPISKGRGG